MSIVLPTKLGVLGDDEFKNLITDMANTIVEMSSTIKDLQRLRAMAPKGGSGGGGIGGNFGFFQINSPSLQPVTEVSLEFERSDKCELPGQPAHAYTGTFYQFAMGEGEDKKGRKFSSSKRPSLSLASNFPSLLSKMRDYSIRRGGDEEPEPPEIINAGLKVVTCSSMTGYDLFVMPSLPETVPGNAKIGPQVTLQAGSFVIAQAFEDVCLFASTLPIHNVECTEGDKGGGGDPPGSPFDSLVGYGGSIEKLDAIIEKATNEKTRLQSNMSRGQRDTTDGGPGAY